MAQIQAYLGFKDNCQEAMEFYQQALGGELDIMTVAQSPVAAHMAAELQDRVLHSSLVKGDLTLLASDMARDVSSSQSVSLMLQCASREEAETYFQQLSEGGTVTHPLGPSFWGALYGEITDRFGIRWLLNSSESSS